MNYIHPTHVRPPVQRFLIGLRFAPLLGLTLCALLLSDSARTAPAATPSCTETDRTGCTELSPTPPEDTVAVPPNIVLMLDDSGSMSWNFMPDWSSLKNNGNNDAVINSANNGVYYNPTVTYTPPPKADGSLNAAEGDLTNVPIDGFGTITTNRTNLYTYNGAKEYRDCGGSVCTGSDVDFNASINNTTYTNDPRTYSETLTADWDRWRSRYVAPFADEKCDDAFSREASATNKNFVVIARDGKGNVTKGLCTFDYTERVAHTTTTNYFQYSTGPANGPYAVAYVAPAAQGCGTQTNCVLDTDTSGVAAPAGVQAGTNIGNWFAYYHTRILMAKSGLMTAFNNLQPAFRFGFGSINDNNASYIQTLAYTTENSRYIATVAPFGTGVDVNGAPITDNQRYYFWNWIQDEKAGSGTPLPSALDSVGKYYKTAGPWKSMPGDPGYSPTSNTSFACRASYAILTTDGFWNGSVPSVGNVDNQNGGGPYSPPANNATYPITQYTPISPFKDGVSNTLADVAMKYWANDLSTMDNLVAPSPKDPAFWQHMTTYTMGMGFDPVGIQPAGTTLDQVFAWARDGGGNSSPLAIANFSWPTPSANSINNIADLAHAAVNGHGDFFSVKSPQDLAAGFAKALSDISARNVEPIARGTNASVFASGALTFNIGYNTGDWSGSFQAVELTQNNNAANVVKWDAGALLDAKHTASAYSGRKIYSVAYDGSGTAGFQFSDSNLADFDAAEKTGLQTPALSGGSDTLANRVKYLMGDPSLEGTVYRTRNHLLGSVIRSEPLYVASPNADYVDWWPAASSSIAASPEAATGAETYEKFVTDHARRVDANGNVTAVGRLGMVYVGANDGMLHAFSAPVPNCTTFDMTTHTCTTMNYGTDGGVEKWAFIPRAAYANLGNLTDPAMRYRPTVDETPVSYDVYFSGDKSWHTLLTGGVGLGGRGVYGLDVTEPGTAANVLWEFDSDMDIGTGCVSNDGSCAATDLGFTIGQPNVGRFANGKWLVLVPNGYFPDCTTPDFPTADVDTCRQIALQAPNRVSGTGKTPYSSLFVLDAETGKVLAELKTPSGYTSYGMSTPVIGDYNHDQIDDVGFAGDALGNLWRFDFRGKDPSKWDVALAYAGVADAKQPITTRPRLLGDPGTNRFMVVFGTGKFLGVGDNSRHDVQAIYGIRDPGPGAASANAATISDLTQRFVHETTGTGAFAGMTTRCVTASAAADCASTNNVPNLAANSRGWYFNLDIEDSSGDQTNLGERVVVSPAAIFSTNQIVFQTLITGVQGGDACSPSTVGAFMVLNAADGGGAGLSDLGGKHMAGARTEHAATSGSTSMTQDVGGGKASLPIIPHAGTAPLPPEVEIDLPTWRRRSWQPLEVGH